MSGKIKIVITHEDTKGLIGVQSPDCDPVLRTFEGDLGSGLERVPGVLEEARQIWETNPQYPKCESPLPSQAAPAKAPGQTTRAATTSRQTPMF